jgi:hypothetical protein
LQLLPYTDAVQIQQSLDDIVSRSVATTGRIHEYQAHRQALNVLAEAIKTELAESRPESPVVGKKLTRRRLSSSTKRSPTRRRSIDNQPEKQLLRHLGIALPQGKSPSTAIDEIARERQGKFFSHLASLESTTESTLAGNLGDLDKANQKMLDALLADSHNSDVVLVEEELVRGIDELEAGIGDVGKGLANVELERFAKKDKAKEQFVRRWAR